jgi:hypothetical protein
MYIQREWTIEFDEKDIISHLGGSTEKLLARPAVQADWEAALADASRLIRPAAVWDTYPIQEFKHNRLVLANGAKITGGPVTAVLAGATELVVAVCTVGDAISRVISELQHNEQRIRAMFLDSLGSWAVGQIRLLFYRGGCMPALRSPPANRNGRSPNRACSFHYWTLSRSASA